MALGSDAVAEMSMNIDRLLFPAQGDGIANERHVFIAGLARAGTTILTRQLHATGAFQSLTYRDMPFVLAPNLWARISTLSRQEMVAEERAHRDGILVDFDSPEAFEEVFWRVTCKEDYIHADRLVPMTATLQQQAEFRRYVASVLHYHADRRYLSKNNNNILRLKTLTRCFPNAKVIVPFREPLEHACSLLRQHQAFLRMHDEDPFSLEYMNWLAHHEFGRGHKPFAFDGDGAAVPVADDPGADLGYWLQTWLNTYGFIAQAAPESCIFLSHERLCDEAETVWPWLCATLELPLQQPAEPFRRTSRTAMPDAPDQLVRRCRLLYQSLRERERDP